MSRTFSSVLLSLALTSRTGFVRWRRAISRRLRIFWSRIRVAGGWRAIAWKGYGNGSPGKEREKDAKQVHLEDSVGGPESTSKEKKADTECDVNGTISSALRFLEDWCS